MNAVRSLIVPGPLRWLALALLSIAAATAAPASAQQHASELTEFNAGDINYRTFVYFEFSSEIAPQVALIPGDGLLGSTFRFKPDGSPGWGKMLLERGYNVYMLDNVGCGRAIEPPSDDFAKLVAMAQFGVEQIGAATIPVFMVAHGQAAGLALYSRSIEPRTAQSLVLVDPIGPQGTQPMTELTPEEVLERWRERDDWNWRRWGFGPRYGKLRRGVDVDEESARAVVDGFDAKQPAYWTALLTPMESGLRVESDFNLRGVPVMVIRTPAADAEQIERENAVVDWMQSMGMEVTRLDLREDPRFASSTGLPWIGDVAEPLLEHVIEWNDGLESVLTPLERQGR